MYTLLPNAHTYHVTVDKLDAVGSFRRRKRRLSSEAEEEELSLTEYIRRKQEEENAGPKKKRVCETSLSLALYIDPWLLHARF